MTERHKPTREEIAYQAALDKEAVAEAKMRRAFRAYERARSQRIRAEARLNKLAGGRLDWRQLADEKPDPHLNDSLEICSEPSAAEAEQMGVRT